MFKIWSKTEVRKQKMKQMALESIVGFFTGLCIMQMRKGIIYLAGICIIWYQAAQTLGVTKKMTCAQKNVSTACIFAGGFLIGVAYKI